MTDTSANASNVQNDMIILYRAFQQLRDIGMCQLSYTDCCVAVVMRMAEEEEGVDFDAIGFANFMNAMKPLIFPLT